MEVRLFATLRQIAGKRSLQIPVEPGQTVGDALRALVERLPKLEEAIWNPDGSLAGHVAVVLNGRDVRHLAGVDTPVCDEDRLDVFPPVGGGGGQMRHVELKFTSHFRARVGKSKVHFAFEGRTLREFIPAVLRRFDLADLLMEGDELRPYVRVVINGRFSYTVGGWEAEIPDGSTVVLIHSYVVAF